MSSALPVTEDELQAYVDERLEPARQAEVRAHLRRHPEVAARIEGYAADRAALRSLLAPVAAEPVPPGLLPRALLARQRRARLAPWWGAAAAALLLVIGGAGGWAARAWLAPAPYGLALISQEAMSNYRVFALDQALPAETRDGDVGDLRQWLATRLDRDIVLPALEPLGYHFTGGRLVATPQGAAALLMYDDGRDGRLVVFLRPMQGPDTLMRQAGGQGLSAYTWMKDNLGYSVIARTSPDQLHPLADEVRRQMVGQG